MAPHPGPAGGLSPLRARRFWAERRLVPVVLATLSAFAPTATRASPSVRDAVALYRSYHQDASRLDRARDILEAELKKDPQPATMLALARVYLAIGDIRAKSEDDKLLAYDRGRAVAQRAVELAPRSVDAHFLYGVAIGRWGETKGMMRSLFLLPTVKAELDAIFEIDPQSPQGHVFAGNLYFELPRLMGGDLDRAEEHFRKGLDGDPHYTAIRLGLARVLMRKGQDTDARRELEAVLGERAPRHLADWVVRDAPRARALLAEIKNKRS